MLVPPYPTPQLVKVRKPVPIGFVDKDRVGVANVQTTFDDRRRQQDIVLAIDKLSHHQFEFVFRHLAMPHADRRFGDDACQFLTNDFDVVHSVVNKVSLPASIQLPQDRCSNHFVAETSNPSFNGNTLRRRRFQIRNVTHTYQ